MNILFAVCSWGLGHIMRSLPIIKKLSVRNKVFVVTSGRSLIVARQSLTNENIKFIEVPDYPQPYTKNPSFFIPKFCLYIPAILHKIKKEHEKIEKIVSKEKINLIISDMRYGAFSKVPSYFITHQLKYIAPLGLTPLTEFFNSLFQKKFNKFFVPDFPDFENSLSGELSHNLKFFNKEKLVYFGIISEFQKKNLKKDIDVFISISGPEVQRGVFERIILNQTGELDKKIIISLGTPEKNFSKKKKNIKIYSYLRKDEREEILNRSKIVVCRSGYSTIMDLTELEKNTLFVPTKNQTEQEYLARFLKNRGNCFFKDQNELNLEKDLEEAEKYKGLKPKWNTKKSLEIFSDNLFK